MTDVDENHLHPEPESGTVADEAATRGSDVEARAEDSDLSAQERCRTSRPQSVSPGARPRAASFRARRTPTGSRGRSAQIPIDLLEEQAQTRLPELGPIRYGRMLVSPFTFFRGAAYLMAADLAGGAVDRLGRATLRRRAPLQLRHLRGAGSEARLQHQRLRRDASGAVRVGPEAARRELSPSRAGIAVSTSRSAARS